jgi:hypothetical protein
MMAKDPARRFQTPAEVATALAEFVPEPPPLPTPEEMPPMVWAGLVKPSSQVSSPTATATRTPGSLPQVNPASGKMLPRR